MSTFVADSPLLSQLANRIAQHHSARTLVANGLVVTCLVSLLTISDAFETEGLSLVHQIGLWAVVCALVVVQLHIAQKLLLKWLAQGLVSEMLANLVAVSMTVLLMTVELHWLKFTPLLPKQPDPLPEFLLFVAPPVAVMAVLLLMVRYLSMPAQQLTAKATQQSVKSRINTNCVERADLQAIVSGKTVLHIQSHDHYLEIKCEEGKYFVRGRMKDALMHLAQEEGMQVHRSHWVATCHLQRLFREGRDSKILLKDGTIVPVARSRIEQLKLD